MNGLQEWAGVTMDIACTTFLEKHGPTKLQTQEPSCQTVLACTWYQVG